MNASYARKAHKILYDLFKGKPMLNEEREFLRNALPELPKQKTLEEITTNVLVAWSCTSDNYWGGNSYGPNISIEDWLAELHAQLKGLKDAPANTPALPEGMRLAEHDEYGRCVVSPATNGNGECLIFVLTRVNESGASWRYVEPGSLTFIDSEPAHPEFLKTEADYESAPDGTIVARSNQIPWVKLSGKQWSCLSGAVANFSMSQNKPRRILRWGWGE